MKKILMTTVAVACTATASFAAFDTTQDLAAQADAAQAAVTALYVDVTFDPADFDAADVTVSAPASATTINTAVALIADVIEAPQYELVKGTDNLFSLADAAPIIKGKTEAEIVAILDTARNTVSTDYFGGAARSAADLTVSSTAADSGVTGEMIALVVADVAHVNTLGAAIAEVAPSSAWTNFEAAAGRTTDNITKLNDTITGATTLVTNLTPAS